MNAVVLSCVVLSAILAQPSDGTAVEFSEASVTSGVLSGSWRVENETLIGRAAPGDMAWWRTPNVHWDFDLTVEFHTPAPANGGVQYRAHWFPAMSAQDGDAHGMHGYQANIDTRDAARTGEVLIRHDEPPLSAASEDAWKTVKPTAWNTMHIVAKGPVARVYVNGIAAASVYDESTIGGFIAFQVAASEDAPAEVHYRNLRIRDLGRVGAWRPLFDGATLHGWKNWGSERWFVEDGVIQGRRGPKESEGYLATEDTWSDFHVRGEFKIRGGGNYGLFYHATIHLRDDGYPIIAGVQGEVEPEVPGDTGGLYESYRRGWIARPDADSIEARLLRSAEWNAIEIRSRGNQVTTWVNGYRVIEFTDPTPQLFDGSFALQLHTGKGAGIDWRELYVKETREEK